jgi:large subunit ribosomal protein L29
MDLKELKKMTVNQLHKLLSESRGKLRDLRFKDASKQLKDVREIRVVKKIIARVLTLLAGNKTKKQESNKTN